MSTKPSADSAEPRRETPDVAFPTWDTRGAPPPRPLSPDEYLAFVEFAWQHTPDKDAIRRQRLRDVPTVPFRVL